MVLAIEWRQTPRPLIRLIDQTALPQHERYLDVMTVDELVQGHPRPVRPWRTSAGSGGRTRGRDGDEPGREGRVEPGSLDPFATWSLSHACINHLGPYAANAELTLVRSREEGAAAMISLSSLSRRTAVAVPLSSESCPIRPTASAQIARPAM